MIFILYQLEEQPQHELLLGQEVEFWHLLV